MESQDYALSNKTLGGNKNKSENIFHETSSHWSEHESDDETKPFELTLVPSICNKQVKDNESIQTNETLEVLNICN